jgi:BirA family biotin operon repressor/biotin-[acetyl-CoA-carboxylase] ligase
VTAPAGWTIHRFATVDSTQHVAAALVLGGAPHRTAVVADRQTAGYGRKGDRWLDAPGDSLLVTLILRPTVNAQADHVTTNLTRFPMIAALAALDAIAQTAGTQGAIKWPNDLLLVGKKVGGVLGDATWSGGRLDALRIGIGINVRGERATFIARGLPDATSILAETGRDLDRDMLLAALLGNVSAYEDALTHGDAEHIVAAWRASVATIGQAVTATLRDGHIIHGIAADVTDDGDLLITDGSGRATPLSAAGVLSLRPSIHDCIPDRSP